ncbi:hypothetical protein Tco_1546886 [Tanacetum coccineum]
MCRTNSGWSRSISAGVIHSTVDGTYMTVLPNSSLPHTSNLSIQLSLPHCSDNSCISKGARRYGDFTTSVAPGTKSRGTQLVIAVVIDKSSGNTSIKSRTTEIPRNFDSPTLVFIKVFTTP